MKKRLRRTLKFKQRYDKFTHALAYVDALPQLTILGMIIGLTTGAIIALFRYLMVSPLAELSAQQPFDFEQIPFHERALIIAIGTAALIALLTPLQAKVREMSIAHVIDRLHNHQGKMPLANIATQFLGALISIASGHSVGREGPAVHVGAGCASQISSLLRLPNNSMTTLIGCGVAAAIAASFNTPLAGVIFAMEVIIKEYTIIGFVPVILASVMGAMLNQVIFGHPGDFIFKDIGESTLSELPYMVFIGLIISGVAACYTRIHLFVLKFNHLHIALRLTLAGALAIIFASFAPQTMGLGYDTVNSAVAGQIGLQALLVIALAKLLLTPTVTALGIPGGLIGPTLFIGACVGAAMATAFNTFHPDESVNSGFYVLMGMAGMMAAVINAPLAALIAVLEFSHNPATIFPAMLVIVVACVSTRHFFKVRGLFIEQLIASNRTLDFSATKQALRRAGVRSVMSTKFVSSQERITIHQAKGYLSQHPDWIIYSLDNAQFCVMAADLANFIHRSPDDLFNEEQSIALDNVPARKFTLFNIDGSANMLEAYQLVNSRGADALCVTQQRSLGKKPRVIGILTKHDIDSYYRPRDFNSPQ